MKNAALGLSGLFFTAIAVLHLLRYKQAWEISINHFAVPLSWSIYGGVIACLFAVLMFAAMRK